MTTDKETLTALLEQVRAAAGANIELDFDLLEMAGLSYYDYTRGWYENEASDPSCINLTKQYWQDMPTRSVDAALALTERVLPGWVVDHIGQNSLHAGDPWSCKLAIYFGSYPSRNRSAFAYSEYQTAPLAILAATLTALIAQDQTP